MRSPFKLDDYLFSLRLKTNLISVAHQPALQPNINDPAVPNFPIRPMLALKSEFDWLLFDI